MRKKSTILSFEALRQRQLYNPYRDAAQRHPSWRIRCVDLGGRYGELIIADERMILIDPRGWHGDEPRAVAHAVCHLDLHPSALGNLSQQHEDEADVIAGLRLDGFPA